MANYNFTMKEFNGTSYDTLYPKTTSQQVLLNDSALATKLGLSGTPTLNDVLNNGALFGEIVTRVGTNSSDVSSPCTLTFSRPVDVIMIVGYSPYSYDQSLFTTTIVMDKESTTAQIGHGFINNISGSSLTVYGRKSADSKQYFWYGSTTGAGSYMMDGLGVTYYFLGISGVKQ